jgi:hypothetical protein
MAQWPKTQILMWPSHSIQCSCSSYKGCTKWKEDSEDRITLIDGQSTTHRYKQVSDCTVVLSVLETDCLTMAKNPQ